jgi:hypothetical protein
VQILHSRKRSGTVAPHGEDPGWRWHLEDQIPVMGNGHEPVQGRPTNDGIEWEVNLRDVELDVLCAEVFLGLSNVTGSAMLPRGYTSCGPTPENGREGPSRDPGICSCLNAAWLMTLSPAPPSISTWCSRMLVMTRVVMSGSIPAPAMLSGQSDAPKEMVVLLHR